MAELRVERRKRGGAALLWVLLALVVLVVAAVLLDRAGYIDVPGISAVQSPITNIPLAASTGAQ